MTLLDPPPAEDWGLSVDCFASGVPPAPTEPLALGTFNEEKLMRGVVQVNCCDTPPPIPTSTPYSFVAFAPLLKALDGSFGSGMYPRVTYPFRQSP